MTVIFSGPEFRALRRQADLTQAEVCEGLISTAYLSLIESGKRHASPALATELLRRIGIEQYDTEAVEQLRQAHEMVRAAYVLNQPTRAYEIGKATLDEHPDLASHPLALLISAQVHQAGGMSDVALEEALEAAEQLSAGSEERASALLIACYAAQSTGINERAIAASVAELKRLPQDVPLSDLKATLRGTCATLLGNAGQVERALEVARMFGDDETNPWVRATSLWSQADIYWENGDYEQALLLARDAMSSVEAANRPSAAAALRVTSAWLELQLPEFDAERVTTLLDEAERLDASNGSPLDNVTGVRAVLLARTGRIDEAIAIHEQLLAALPASHSSSRAVNLLWLGRFEAARGNKSGAVARLDQALSELQQTNHQAAAARTWRVLGATYESLGDIAKALECMKQSSEYTGLRLAPIDQPDFLLV